MNIYTYMHAIYFLPWYLWLIHNLLIEKKNHFSLTEGLWTRLLGLTRKLRVATGKTVISVSVLPDQKGGCKSTSRGWINYLSLISQSLLNLFLHEIGFNDSLNFHLSISSFIFHPIPEFPFLKGSRKWISWTG